MGNQRVTWQHITSHTRLHASTDCSDANFPPCESVAKLMLSNSFSVTKLVTWEDETVSLISVDVARQRSTNETSLLINETDVKMVFS